MFSTDVTIYSLDEWGAETAHHLLQYFVHGTHKADPKLDEVTISSNGGCTIFLAAQPATSYCEKLDFMAHAQCSSFVPAVFVDLSVHIGPLVRPGTGICWRCANTRQIQGAEDPNGEIQRQEFYTRTPQRGPSGFLPSLCSLTAALVARECQKTDREISSSSVVKVGAYACFWERCHMVGVTDCDRCGSTTITDNSRWDGMSRDLEGEFG